ncbi:polyunsaturated fatty acid lipoxygenase ALOX12 isoform X5 [Carassius gibelio]|uniref:polyunsaturated fatty acid lipoxygenase ALOX12 isoform X1 n=1 Tax=Carassius gibelio TaxID=101364 RepID=UPI00227803D3|nr:polyunsaturated fatty acid lipoxygenase ALOX12 isoform X1 [Carassius gibelio]XP_052458212.1 polyunsaturated fatty acid lipoxygenase ALOX12 isoform X2 [Carassius gibelio]XP_052458213.1 polyunsaturated fatty acid lipoxygenase ALOX12 isoform X3 [Carassius gibelio]XP_052458214.1 polyunsaturated fatty acid lipoxygenase ALOX12 isoform X4 [Carassius gibelio]XP_052458215.1 polyunsaturated fatty acid lipoxygenase ALOX12 isoform X5 [Carassius gibelio]
MEYKVTVATGTSKYSGTNNYIYLTLVGERGESERTVLDNPGQFLLAVDEYTVKSSADLGPLILVRLEKQKFYVEDNWFCRYVKVSIPGERRSYSFPCYRWLVGDKVIVELREGTAKKISDDTLPLEISHRTTELLERQKIYRWLAWAPGIPKCIDAKSEADLPQDARFDNEKRSDFEGSLQYALMELNLKNMVMMMLAWKDMEDFKKIFWTLKSPIAEYTMNHWKEDSFFGYQFLNGSNPRMISRCKELPSNFRVTGDMVQSSLIPTTTLKEELKKGNIFLVDQAIMDGIPANVIRDKAQHIAAPLCLLYEHPEKGLIPIAIQLEQKPDKETPIFLPSDPPLAWLLAKMWVRHSEFQIFQVLSHLLRTHLVAEVFCVATLRQLPAVHPIYKLLAPHLRYTLEINCRSRSQLISSEGIFKRVVSTGGDGLLILAQRGYKVLTYRSLQPKFDFMDRGVTKIKDYYYRDHSMMLWDVIQNFVSGIVSLYYKSDREVEQDSEIQAWINDVAVEGFVDLPHFGLASELKTKEELITLLSMVIFTSTSQHAATNNGQFDWCAWVPNTPCTMRRPPPTDKDAVTMDMIMDTLPDISQSCMQMAITWLLGRAQPDAIPLGQYVEQYFTEPAALKVIDQFRKELKELDKHIIAQNEGQELPYLYLSPSRIENSITI